MAEENKATSAVLYWYGDNCFTESHLANIIEELDSQGVTVTIQEGQNRDAYYTDKKTKVCGKYRSRVHKIVGKCGMEIVLWFSYGVEAYKTTHFVANSCTGQEFIIVYGPDVWKISKIVYKKIF